MLLLLMLMKGLGLSAAKASGECSRLAAWYSIIHEVVAVSDSVVIRAFEPFYLSYHSVLF